VIDTHDAHDNRIKALEAKVKRLTQELEETRLAIFPKFVEREFHEREVERLTNENIGLRAHAESADDEVERLTALAEAEVEARDTADRRAVAAEAEVEELRAALVDTVDTNDISIARAALDK
jgi:chromosome segregation ATPase